MNPSFRKKWLVAKIKSNSHDLAFRNLERQGFEAFFPKMKVTIKKENKFISKDVLVFPGYVFVGIDFQNSSWTKIKSTYGVSKLLSFNNKPCEIPLNLIMTLKNKYVENVNPITNQKTKKDDKINFNNGPFVDLVASIESIDAKKRSNVLLEVMEGQRKVQINRKEKITFIKI